MAFIISNSSGDKMNEYKYEEIAVGHKESFEVTITQEMVDSFRNITQDVNPLHRDEEYAREKGHPGTVVFGMLTASFLSTLAGVYLPGKLSLIQEVKIKFAKPVYVGDVITVEGVVDEKNDTFNLLMIKYSMKNQDGVKVMRGSMQVSAKE